MKKKLLGMVVVAVVAIVAGYNVYISQNETKLSDLVLANVEAFAWGGETSGSYYLHPCPTHAGAECSSKKYDCLLYTSPSPRDPKTSRMPSSA